MEESKKIILVSNDGVKREISKKAAQRSLFIKNAIEDYQDNVVPLTKVKGQILDKVIEYLNHYENCDPDPIKEPLEGEFKDCVNEWDFKFIDIELDLIFEILLAAHNMNIEPLLKLVSARLAAYFRGKTTEELRKIFNIDDFTEEELKEIEEESKYCTDEL